MKAEQARINALKVINDLAKTDYYKTLSLIKDKSDTGYFSCSKRYEHPEVLEMTKKKLEDEGYFTYYNKSEKLLTIEW